MSRSQKGWFMNVLITGAGLIGCHAAGRLLAKGHAVVLYDMSPDHPYIRSVAGETKGLSIETGDTRDLPALLTVMGKYGIDTIVHTAGLIGKKVEERPYTGFTVNVQGTMHVAEAVRVLKAKRVVFVSTFGVYNWGIPAHEPVTEDFPLGSGGLYSATKVANESLLNALANLSGFELIILRPAGVFGRGHYRGGSTVGIVIDRLVRSATHGETVRLEEALLGTNEYVYVKDVAQAVEKACAVSEVKGRAFNVGSGRLYSAQEIAEKVRAAFPGARVELVPAGPGEEVKRHGQPLDLSRARAELGYEPEYSLEVALSDYLQE